MGRSITPTFAVKVFVKNAETGRDLFYDLMSWPTNHAGRPTDASLAEYVRQFEASTEPGGVNAHLGREFVTSAYVKRQRTGERVATYTAPMFQVIA